MSSPVAHVQLPAAAPAASARTVVHKFGGTSVADAERYRHVAQLLALRRVLPRFILGGGSNLVFAGDFDGLVLHMAIAGRRLAHEDADAWYVEAGAGENWHEFVLWTLRSGWPGLWPRT